MIKSAICELLGIRYPVFQGGMAWIAELEALAVGKLRMAVQEGDSENGCFLSGQIAALVRKEQPAAEIVREVAEEAEPLPRRACAWVD